MNIRQVLVTVALCGLVAQAQNRVPLPNKPNTLHFAVIGDNGNGDREEYEVGDQMAKWYDRFQFPLVIMAGDNIYGSERPQDFVTKFEAPYKALLDKGASPNIAGMGLTPFLIAAGVGTGGRGTGLAASTSAGGNSNPAIMDLLLQHGEERLVVALQLGLPPVPRLFIERDRVVDRERDQLRAIDVAALRRRHRLGRGFIAQARVLEVQRLGDGLGARVFVRVAIRVGADSRCLVRRRIGPGGVGLGDVRLGHRRSSRVGRA